MPLVRTELLPCVSRVSDYQGEMLRSVKCAEEKIIFKTKAANQIKIIRTFGFSGPRVSWAHSLLVNLKHKRKC